MRILLLRKRGEWAYASPYMFHQFEQAVGRIADCIWAGPGWPLYKEGETLDQTVKRIYGNNPPDWVIDRERVEKLDPNREYMVGHHLTDLHGRNSAGIKNTAKLVKLINKMNYDAVFLKTKYIYNVKVPYNYVTDNLTTDWDFLPYSVDPEIFKPLQPKTWDVTLIGSISNRYPLRKTVWENLPGFCTRYGLKPLMINAGPRPSWTAAKHENDPQYYIRGRYAEALGRTRFLVFDSSIYGYALQKYFEAPASGCIPLTTLLPIMGKELGFIDGETYVTVHRKNWRERLIYYHTHDDEAEIIKEKGRELILNRHTHDIRALQFIEILEKFI